MRSEIALNDRVRVIATGRVGMVTAVTYLVRFEDPASPDAAAFSAPTSELQRLVPLEEITSEARAQSEAAGAAIERAQAMIAALSDAHPERSDLLAELGELAGELAGLVPGVPSALARQIAAVATRIASLIEREASR